MCEWGIGKRKIVNDRKLLELGKPAQGGFITPIKCCVCLRISTINTNKILGESSLSSAFCYLYGFGKFTSEN